MNLTYCFHLFIWFVAYKALKIVLFNWIWNISYWKTLWNIFIRFEEIFTLKNGKNAYHIRRKNGLYNLYKAYHKILFEDENFNGKRCAKKLITQILKTFFLIFHYMFRWQSIDYPRRHFRMDCDKKCNLVHQSIGLSIYDTDKK